jgi:hypothetical protein
MPGQFPRLLALVAAGMVQAPSLPGFAQQASAPAADSTPATEAPRLCTHGICANAYASLSYTYNTNDPKSNLNQLRVFDFTDNEPQLDAAQLVIQHAIDKPRQFGFRFNLLAGSGVPTVTAASGLFRSRRSGRAQNVDIPEMYVSYDAPLGAGLRVDVGKFATYMGLEVIGGYDGYNAEFSRGFLFGYGVPFTHTGVRAAYVFNNKVTGLFMVSNGWDDFQRRNHGLTWGGQVMVTPTSNAMLSLSAIHGPERPDDDRDQRDVGEVIGTLQAWPRMSFAFDALYGHEDRATALGHDADWKALAGYAKYNLTRSFSTAFRGEIFGDSSGTRTGAPQTLAGFTLTPEYDMPAKLSQASRQLERLDGHVVVRCEFRVDLSNKNAYQQDSSWRRQQFTTAINLIYYF